jgi:hypothetical protein
MGNINLAEIIGETETLEGVFNYLKNAEIMIGELKQSYIPIVARKEFVILEDIVSKDRTQYLHPYGTRIGYCVHHINSEKVK